MFARGAEPNVRLDPYFWDVQDKVSNEDNNVLVEPFSEEEIKSAIFSCYPEGTPGPDGLPFLLYQNFWDLVKDDFVDLFKDFHKGSLDLYRLNCALVSLVPKVGGYEHETF